METETKVSDRSIPRIITVIDEFGTLTDEQREKIGKYTEEMIKSIEDAGGYIIPRNHCSEGNEIK